MSFWYGLEFADLSQMPIAAIKVYVERLPARMAEFKLAMADAASVPHMKKNERAQTLRDWKRTVEKFGGSSAIIPLPVKLRLMGISVKSVGPPVGPPVADPPAPKGASPQMDEHNLGGQ